MKPLSDDTHPEIERLWIDGLRRRTPAQRFHRIGELNATLQRLAEIETRQRHPDAPEREIRLRVAARRLPAELMRRAFGWDPDREGY